MNISESFNFELNEKQREAFNLFKSGTSFFLSGPAGVLVFYDVNNRQSFIDVEKWINEMKACNDLHKLTIIGNKIDIPEHRQVSYEEGEKLAKRYDGSV